MEKEIDLRRLVIKAFHITEVEEGGENKVTASGKMTIEKKILDEILPKYPQLSKLDVQIIRPGEHDRYTNTMMDIIDQSTWKDWGRDYAYAHRRLCNPYRCR